MGIGIRRDQIEAGHDMMRSGNISIRECQVCHAPMPASKRPQAITCGYVCRKRMQRKRSSIQKAYIDVPYADTKEEFLKNAKAAWLAKHGKER